MRSWRFWEWTAYVSLWIGALVMATDTSLKLASGDLRHSMSVVTESPIWGFAPLACFILGTFILFGREAGILGTKAAVALDGISQLAHLEVNGPHLFEHDRTIRRWRVRITNSGPAPALNVKMRLRNIVPRPRYPVWTADYPYPVQRVAPEGLEFSNCQISPNDGEKFEIISSWVSSGGQLMTDGLGAKYRDSGRSRVPIESDERWTLAYEVLADNSDVITFKILVSPDGDKIRVEKIG
jgi:hypothetical protein